MVGTKTYLKPKFLEKPFALDILVRLLKLDLGLSPALRLRAGLLKSPADSSSAQGDIQRVPCGHEVIVGTKSHKRLGLGPLDNFPL